MGQMLDNEEISTPAFDKARMLYLRRTQQQLVEVAPAREMQQLSGGHVLHDLMRGYHSLGFAVDGLPRIFYQLTREGSLNFDGDELTLSTLERITEALEAVRTTGQMSAVSRPFTTDQTLTRSTSRGPFPWPIVDMAELEFGTGSNWVDTHTVAIVTGLPRMNSDETERLRSLLLKLLQHIATIEDIWLPMNAEQELSKGFAFVRADTRLGAWKVGTAIDGFPWPLHTDVDNGRDCSNLQARMFSAYGKDPANVRLPVVPPGPKPVRAEGRRSVPSPPRRHRRRSATSSDSSSSSISGSSSSSYAGFDEDIVRFGHASDEDEEPNRSSRDGRTHGEDLGTHEGHEQPDNHDSHDVKTKNHEDASSDASSSNAAEFTHLQSRQMFTQSKTNHDSKSSSMDDMLPFLRELSSARQQQQRQLNRTAPVSTPVTLPPVDESLGDRRRGEELVQALRELNSRLRHREGIASYRDELDTLDLHLDIAAANNDILRMFAAEQANLQLHGIVAKNASRELSSGAIFELYQKNTAAVQKFLQSENPQRWSKVLRKEQVQQLSVLFERLRSTTLLGVVAEMGHTYEQEKQNYTERIHAMHALQDAEYMRLRDQMRLARSLKAENDVLREKVLTLEDARTHQAVLWERRVKELQEALVTAKQAQSAADVEKLMKQLGTMPAYCARLDNECDFTDMEGALEAALAQVRKAKMDFIQRRAREEDGGERNQQSLCVICIDKEKSVLLMPCRHLCVCEDCASKAELSRCPVCRNRVVETIKVFA